MSYAKKIIQGGSIIFIMYLIGGLLGYVLRMYLARTLSVNDFGMFYAIIAFIGFFTLFRDPGFSTTLTKFTAEFNNKKEFSSIKSMLSTVLIFEIIISLVLVSAIFLFSDYISLSYFKVASAAMPLRIITLSYFVSLFMAMQYVLLGLMKVKYYSIIEPLRNIFTLSATVLLIGLGVIGAAIGYLVAAVVLVAITGLFLVKSFPVISAKMNINRELTKKMLLFSFPVFLSSVAGTILGYTDTIVITFFMSVKEVGLYQVAFPTSQMLWVLTGSLSVIILPIISEMSAKKDFKNISEILSLLSKYLFVLVLPIVIMLVAFPELVINILFGSNFIAAAPVLQILVLSSLFYPIFSLLSASMVAIGKPALNTKIIAFMSLINLAMNLLLVPSIGIIGAGISTTVSYFIGTGVIIFFMRRTIKINFYFSDMIKSFIGGAFSFALVLLLKGALHLDVWLEIILTGVACVAFYTFFVIVTRTIRKDEIRKIKQTGVPVPEFIIEKLS